MTVQDLYDLVRCAPIEIKVKSGYNGKILCKNYIPLKHKDLSSREVIQIWSEIRTLKSSYNDRARSIICIYVDGHKEYEEYIDSKMLEGSV